MSNRNKRTRNELERLRLPELQARFREVVGETSRSPNRNYAERGDMRSRLAPSA